MADLAGQCVSPISVKAVKTLDEKHILPKPPKPVRTLNANRPSPKSLKPEKTSEANRRSLKILKPGKTSKENHPSLKSLKPVKTSKANHPSSKSLMPVKTLKANRLSPKSIKPVKTLEADCHSPKSPSEQGKTSEPHYVSPKGSNYKLKVMLKKCDDKSGKSTKETNPEEADNSYSQLKHYHDLFYCKCGSTFSSKKLLKLHKVLCIRKQKKNNSKSSRNLEKITCKCGRECKSKGGFTNHKKHCLVYKRVEKSVPETSKAGRGPSNPVCIDNPISGEGKSDTSKENNQKYVTETESFKRSKEGENLGKLNSIHMENVLLKSDAMKSVKTIGRPTYESSVKVVDIDMPSLKCVDIDDPSLKPVDIDDPSLKPVDIEEPISKAVDIDDPSLKPVDEPISKAVDIDEPSLKSVDINEPISKAVDIDESRLKAVDVDEQSCKAIDVNKPSLKTPESISVNVIDISDEEATSPNQRQSSDHLSVDLDSYNNSLSKSDTDARVPSPSVDEISSMLNAFINISKEQTLLKPQPVYRYTCRCGAKFHTKTAFRRHRMSHYRNIMKCYWCPFQTKYKTLLRAHVLKTHSNSVINVLTHKNKV